MNNHELKTTLAKLGRQWWMGPVLLAALALVALTIWLIPSRVNEVVSVDSGHRWPHTNAPPPDVWTTRA